MSLFRRLRRDKEEPEAEKPAPAEPSAPAAKSAPPASVPVDTTPTSGPTTPAPPRMPPPLPDRAAAEPSSSVSRPSDARSKCFICGTPLEAHACPTCRMTWVE